ncbi:MAG: archaeal proteasome endopeptidase complex subunit alpha [Salinirussus sp.]
MQSNQQQAYDRGITIFSPDGRLYQVEYAREAVRRGSASIGIRTGGGVVLAADRQIRSPLVERDSVEKLHAIDDHIGIASAGHVADARQLVDIARRHAQIERLRYDQPVDVESLTKAVTDHVQGYTQTGGARPFGVSLLVGGVDDSGPRLFETDPSGTPTEWQAVAIGGGRDKIQDHLENEYDPATDLDGGIGLALSSLAAAEGTDVTADSVDVATIDAETGEFGRLDADTVANHLAEADIGGESNE